MEVDGADGEAAGENDAAAGTREKVMLARELDGDLFVLFLRNLHVTSSVAVGVGVLCSRLAEEVREADFMYIWSSNTPLFFSNLWRKASCDCHVFPPPFSQSRVLAGRCTFLNLARLFAPRNFCQLPVAPRSGGLSTRGEASQQPSSRSCFPLRRPCVHAKLDVAAYLRFLRVFGAFPRHCITRQQQQQVLPWILLLPAVRRKRKRKKGRQSERRPTLTRTAPSFSQARLCWRCAPPLTSTVGCWISIQGDAETSSRGCFRFPVVI